jgi:N-acetyl-anhydromuramyl-L-alanine amidase AmpD
MMNEFHQKKQIILTHTSRKGEDYLKSIEYRYNGVYDKLPHYVILKDGTNVKICDENKVTNFFHDDTLNNQSIIVSLENLGWVDKDVLSPTYSNWLNQKVDGKIKERKWRQKFFWDLYTDEQMETLVNLCNIICETHNIPKKFIGHNTKLDNLETFEGILNRSNFYYEYTDLSPAFNFVYLLEKFNYE